MNDAGDVFGEHYLATLSGGWRKRWYVYKAVDALDHGARWVWRCTSKETAVQLVKMLDQYKSKQRPAAASTDSVLSDVEPQDVK